MRHDIATSDSDFLEAYERVTKLLQTFIDRQCRLRELNKKNGNTSEAVFEQQINADVIHFIQWIRYHFWGNDDKTIINKTNITDWTFRNWTFSNDSWYIGASDYCIKQSPFARDILKVDPSVEYLSATELVEAILEVIIPKREHSIFAIDDQVEESISLKLELDRIKQKIHPTR